MLLANEAIYSAVVGRLRYGSGSAVDVAPKLAKAWRVARDNGDLAGTSYWNQIWASSPPPAADLARRSDRWGFPTRAIERLVRRWLERVDGRNLLELGCARSIWLPHWAKELGYSVTGIDYSELGCQQTRDMLARAGVQGRVVCGDFFAPTPDLVGTFDVVTSFGVVEHFADTRGCVEQFARYMRPGGILITLVPNMTGVPGLIQKHVNNPVFKKHVPLTRELLDDAHRSDTLVPEESGYLLSSNFGVLNLDGLPRDASWVAKKVFIGALSRMSMMTWYIEEKVIALPATSYLAPYVYCVARHLNKT